MKHKICDLSVACIHVVDKTAEPIYLKESEMYVCKPCLERLIEENFPEYLMKDYTTICIDCLFSIAKEN